MVETKFIKLIILVKAGYYMLFMSTFDIYGKNQNYKICNFGFVHKYLEYALGAAFVVKTKIIKVLILVKAGYYILFMSTMEVLARTKIIKNVILVGKFLC